MPKSFPPRFFLYGEPPRAADDRFLHIEPLDERCRPAEWRILPHSHSDLHHLFHLHRGCGSISADTETLHFIAPCLLIVPAGIVHGFLFESGTAGTVLTLSDRLVRDMTHHEPEFQPLFEMAAQFQLQDAAQLTAAFEGLRRELACSAPGHRTAINAFLSLVFVETIRIVSQGVQKNRAAPGEKPQLVARFRDLIEKHFRLTTSVGAYARELGVSIARLRDACLTVAGATPVQLIHDRLLLEAKRALLYSDMTVAETGYSLGFSDPAYFSRFFSKHAGASAIQFRNRKGLLNVVPDNG